MLSDSPPLNRSPSWHVVFNLPPSTQKKKKSFSPVNERIHKEEPQTLMAIIMLIRSALRCTFNIIFERSKSGQLQSISPPAGVESKHHVLCVSHSFSHCLCECEIKKRQG